MGVSAVTSSDVSVDVGHDQVTVGAEREGVEAAVLVDGGSYVDDRELGPILAEALGSTVFAGGSLLERRNQDSDGDAPGADT